jgi:hypothetical protein
LSVRTCDLEPRRGIPPTAASCPDVALLTNLFGGGFEAGDCPSIGTPEACEKVMDDESGPMLDLRLPCWDMGRRDSRRIQDSLDDIESLAFSAMGWDARSPGRMSECLLLLDRGEETEMAVRGRGALVGLVGLVRCEVRGPGPASASWRKEAYGNSSAGDGHA